MGLLMNHEKIILWGLKTSPYVRKVMVALVEKDLRYEQIEIPPQRFLTLSGQAVPVDFAQASPLGKIPALQIGTFGIADSAVITAYLDKKFPTSGALLYPSNPEEYASALWFEHYADVTLSDISYKKIFVERIIKPALFKIEGNYEIANHAMTNELPPLLDYLNQSVADKAWFAGAHFSMADVAIAVQLLALKKAGLSELENRWPDLNKHLSKVISRPSFQEIN